MKFGAAVSNIVLEMDSFLRNWKTPSENAGITPDFTVENAADPDNIKIAHRTSPDADIYFVANLVRNQAKLCCFIPDFRKAT